MVRSGGQQPLRRVTAITAKSSVLPWRRAFLVVALWLSAIVSAMGVVYSSYLTRHLTQNYEALRRENSQLRVLAGQLQLERSSWAAYSRIEQIATEELAMSLPKSDETMLIVRP